MVLRVARGLGSITLTVRTGFSSTGCGLLAGWDRLHLEYLPAYPAEPLRVARGLESTTLLTRSP